MLEAVGLLAFVRHGGMQDTAVLDEMFLLLLKGPSQPSAATYDGSVVGAVGGSTLCGSPGYFIYPLILVSVIAVSVDRIFFFFLSMVC